MQSAAIDTWLKTLPIDAAPGCPQSIEIHKRLQDLFLSFTGLEKRSLASKYLHFHFPNVFYIYDSRARRAIQKLVTRLTSIPDTATEIRDSQYKDFVRRCSWLRSRLDDFHGVRLTPREIDNLLLATSARNLKPMKTTLGRQSPKRRA